MKKNKVVFAIFGNGNFISWTYGMFTQLVDFPKIYDESEKQIEVVVKNFYSKIRKIKNPINLSQYHPGFKLVDLGSEHDNSILSNYSEFELKMYYIGDKEEYSQDDLNSINLETPVKVFPYIETDIVE